MKTSFLRILLSFLFCNIIYTQAVQANGNTAPTFSKHFMLSAPAKAYGGAWIPVKITIPAAHISKLPLSINLSYTGEGSWSLIEPTALVTIPVGQQEVITYLDVENISGSDKPLTIVASDGSNAVEADVLLLSAIKSSGVRPVLTASNDTILGGDPIKLKVRIPEVNKTGEPLQVLFHYSGEGENFINSALPSKITIPEGEQEVTLHFNTKSISGEPKMLKIVAQVNGFSRYKNHINISLVSSQIILPGNLLSFPSLPEIKVEKGKVVPDLVSSIQHVVRSSTSLKGFWVACKLRYGYPVLFSQDYWDETDKTLFFWVPYPSNSSKLYYSAHANYKADSKGGHLLTHNEGKKIQLSDRKGYSCNMLVNIFKNKPAQYSTTLQAEMGWDNFKEKLGFGVIGNIKPVSGIANHLGVSLADASIENITTSADHEVKWKTPFVEKKLGAYGSALADYQKAILHFSPQVDYQVCDENGLLLGAYDNLIDIEQYMPHSYIENYLQRVLKNDGVFRSYLEQFPLVSKANDDFKHVETWNSSRQRGNSHKIILKSYAVGLFSCLANYGDLDKYTVSKEVPLAEADDFAVLDLYVPSNTDHAPLPLVTLSASKTTLAKDDSITVTLTYASPPAEGAYLKLSYEGDSAKFLEGPQNIFVNQAKTGELSVASFVVKTTPAYSLSDNNKAHIVVKVLDKDGRPHTLARMKLVLKSSEYHITEIDKSELQFPPIPDIKLDDNRVVLASKEKIITTSQQIPDGFFVTCKLKNSLRSRYDKSDKLFYFWVPLKKDKKKNRLRYQASCEYRLGKTNVLEHNEISTVSDSYYEKIGAQKTSSSFDDQFYDTNRGSTMMSESLNTNAITRLDDISEGSALGASSGNSRGFVTPFQYPGFGVQFSSDFWSNSSKNSHRNTTKSQTHFNSNTTRHAMESKMGYTWGKKSGVSNIEMENTDVSLQHSDNITKMGPLISHFKKIYAFVQPLVTYSLVDPDHDEPQNIEEYIDYADFKFSGRENLKTVNEYIRCIMKVGGDGKKINLAKYLAKYPQMKSLNPDLAQYSIEHIDIDDYSIQLSSFKAPFGAVFVCKESPVDCSSPVGLKPHHQFAMREKVASKFSWDAPASATEFELEIKREDQKWGEKSYVYSVPRSYGANHKQPNEKVTYVDLQTPYAKSGFYDARFRFKCGVSSQWSAYSDAVRFTYDRSNCQVDVKSIKVSKMPTLKNSYRIEWNKVNHASGYFTEYADEVEGLANARQRLSPGPGKTNPFDIAKYDTTLVYTSASDKFLIKITPECDGMRGLERVIDFDFTSPLQCPRISEDRDPIVCFFNDNGHLKLDWDSDYLHDHYQIRIIEKGNSWKKNYYVKTMSRPTTGLGVPEPIDWLISDKKFYEGTTYVARIYARCLAVSRKWGDDFLELEFEGEVPNPASNSSYTNDGIYASSYRDKKEMLEEVASDVILNSPSLLIYPNPIVGDAIQFTVKNVPLGVAMLEITSLLSGKSELVHKVDVVKADDVFAVSKNLDPGVYIMYLTLADGSKLSQKFKKSV